MAITAQQVKELRDKTGAGMGECKKALEESNGDMQGAIEYLRKRGAASAAKRSDRTSNEGIIVTKTTADGKNAAIVEINCETDFVARNEEFVDFANAVTDVVLTNNPGTLEELLAENLGDKTVEDYMNEILAKFSERIIIKRFERLTSSGYIAEYIHMGNKLGVLLEISTAPNNDEAKGLMRDITMQIAAMNPSFISREQVDNATLENEKVIYFQQAVAEGKNEDLAARIATGKLEKYYQDFCLLEQAFVKDSGKVINDVLKEISKFTDSDAKILNFRRYFLGAE